MSYTEPDLMSPAEEQSVIRILNVTRAGAAWLSAGCGRAEYCRPSG